MDLDLTYQAAVRNLAARFRWGLLTESAWIAAAQKINPEPENDKAARRACLTVYSRTLHAACQDRRRQNRAYRELYDYLFPQAYARDRSLAREATHDAITLVFRSFTEPKLAKCRIPEAFLFFALGKLRDAIKRIYYERNGERGNVPLDDLVDDDYQGGDYWLPASPAPHTPESDLLDDDRELWIKAMVLSVAESVLRCLQTLWEEGRLHKQVETILLTFMDRMTDEQIAAKLRKTKGAVQLLRTHALDNLRACLDLRIPLSWGGE